MKQVFSLSLIVLFLAVNNINAQCLDFVKTTGFNKLNTELYVPEGRFDAMTLSEGDYLKVYKSFFRGKKYRVVVIADKIIPSLHFQIKTMQGEVIYDNSKITDKEIWEYTSDRNQNLMISIELPASSGANSKSGCVAVILGHKM